MFHRLGATYAVKRKFDGDVDDDNDDDDDDDDDYDDYDDDE